MEWSWCAWKGLWGIDCPGCGLTRSLWALLSGDIEASIALHPMGVVVFLWVANLWWLRRFKFSNEGRQWVSYGVLFGFTAPWLFKFLVHSP